MQKKGFHYKLPTEPTKYSQAVSFATPSSFPGILCCDSIHTLCVIKQESAETLSKDPILECKHENVQGCVSQEGPEECHDKQVVTLVDVPEETCDLKPQKTCRLVTKLAWPSRRLKQECTTVPCTLKFTQPKRVEKSLQTEYCRDEGGSQPT